MINFNFYIIHLIFRYEDLLREKEPCLAIPYWDSSLDYHMNDPIQSIIWTPTFLGNGDGQVVNGPFGGWTTGFNTPLARNIGSGGSLISKRDIRRVLRYYNNINADITDLFGRPNDAIELYHNGPHVWVDGHMSGLNSAAEDPVFYMHHAFIDCWWQVFREKIWRNHGVNSTFDYPQINGLHNGNLPMDPWGNITNSEGYADYWASKYKCQRFPRCSKRFRKYCRSPYLVCQDFDDRPRARCVSVSGAQSRVPVVPTLFADEGFLPQGVFREIAPQATLEDTPNRPLMPPGPTFQAFKIDNRTLGDPLQRRISELNVPPQKRQKRDVSDAQPSAYAFPSCNAIKGVASLHYSIAYLDPAQKQGVNNEFVYIPIMLVLKPNTRNRYTALVYGLKYNTRYRVYLHTVPVHNSTVAVVPMLNPELVNLEYIVTVVDGDGTMCRPECLEDPVTQKFGPCTGGIMVNTDIPDMYRTTYKGLVDDLNTEDQLNTNNWIGKYIFLKFTCV